MFFSVPNWSVVQQTLRWSSACRAFVWDSAWDQPLEQWGDKRQQGVEGGAEWWSSLYGPHGELWKWDGPSALSQDGVKGCTFTHLNAGWPETRWFSSAEAISEACSQGRVTFLQHFHQLGESAFLLEGESGWCIPAQLYVSLRWKSKDIYVPSVCLGNQRKINAVQHSFNIRIFDESLKIAPFIDLIFSENTRWPVLHCTIVLCYKVW